MTEQKSTPSRPRRSGADADLPADAPGPGSPEVQENVDAANERGYFGVEADPTPDSHYTVEGQLAGKPTPETDKDHRRKVAAQLGEAHGRY